MIVRFDIGYKVECELTADHTKLKKAIGGIVANRDRIRIMSGVIHQVVFREFAGVEGRRASFFWQIQTRTCHHSVGTAPLRRKNR